MVLVVGKLKLQTDEKEGFGKEYLLHATLSPPSPPDRSRNAGHVLEAVVGT